MKIDMSPIILGFGRHSSVQANADRIAARSGTHGVRPCRAAMPFGHPRTLPALLALFSFAAAFGPMATQPAVAQKSKSEPTASADEQERPASRATKQRVPLELLPTYHIAVPVRANGKGPFRMIFDLGAPVVLISGRVAAEAGLISAEVAAMPTLLGIRGQGTLKTFQIGDVVARDLPVMIVDHPAIQRAQPVLGRIDGIVGMSFFGRYRMTIDYANKYIEFEPAGHKPRDVMMQMFARLFGPREPKPIASPTLWGLSVEDAGDEHQPGVIVRKLWPESPAADAGLREGDKIIEINGRWTDSPADAVAAAASAEPGKPVPVLIERNGKRMSIQVTPQPGL